MEGTGVADTAVRRRHVEHVGTVQSHLAGAREDREQSGTQVLELRREHEPYGSGYAGVRSQVAGDGRSSSQRR
jgi:hypothetical protein